jgi:cytochrome c oxidase cbb3-type subunit III
MSDIEHIYDDDIREHDNKLPRWWLLSLFAAMVFAVSYWFVYHQADLLPLPREAYNEDWARIERERVVRLANSPTDDATLAALVNDANAVATGATVFASNCLACHGDKAQGLVGPNLTDNSWIHGAKPSDIHRVISEGVLAKGMPSWAAQLGDNGMRNVTAWVLAQKGKNVPGKPPEGTPAP